jgi:integrase
VPRERYQRGRLERVGKRTKQWKGIWYVYIQTPDGEHRKHTSDILGRCADLTRAEAQKKLDERIAEGDKSPAATARLTVEQFIRRVYLPAHERGWSTNTHASYTSILRRWIIPHLGAMPITDVRKMHAVDFANAMADANRSHKSIQATLAVLHTIMEEAVDNRIIPANPIQRVSNPQQPATGAKPVLSLEQIRQLLSRTSGRVRILFRVLVLCGLRIGEALTLRWRSIEGLSLRVSESTDVRRKGPKATKTGLVRLVPLPADLAADLAGMRHNAYFSGDDDFVFGHPKTGRYMQRTAAHRHFCIPARESSGLGALLDFRICRRTLATRLKEEGVGVKDIQAILGHTAAAMTERHYIQPVEASQRAAVERLAKLI